MGNKNCTWSYSFCFLVKAVKYHLEGKKLEKAFPLQVSGIIYYKLSDYFSQEITSILPANEEKINIKEGRNSQFQFN